MCPTCCSSVMENVCHMPYRKDPSRLFRQEKTAKCNKKEQETSIIKVAYKYSRPAARQSVATCFHTSVLLRLKYSAVWLTAGKYFSTSNTMLWHIKKLCTRAPKASITKLVRCKSSVGIAPILLSCDAYQTTEAPFIYLKSLQICT